MFFYKKIIKNGYVIQNSQPEHAKQLEGLQRKVFPTLSNSEIMTAAHYLKHIQVFPEGQFVVLDGEKVIGMSSTMRYHLSYEPHTFLEISDNLWIEGTHEPNGDWLYGLDVGVDPDYRSQGIAREIYRARQEVARHFGLKGQITVGMMNGYGKVEDEFTVEEYFDKLMNRDLIDPTVSAQQKLGFKIISLITDYLDDPTCGNAGVLMTMEATHEV